MIPSFYKPTIIKDVLDEKVLEDLRKTILSTDFPWYFSQYQDNEKTHDMFSSEFYNSKIFRHDFIRGGVIKTSPKQAKLLVPIVNFLCKYFNYEDLNIQRMNINLLPKDTEHINKHSYPHTDIQYTKEFLELNDTYTAIFYFDDGNGDTLLMDNNNIKKEIGRITPIKNSIALFDSRQWHCAPCCGDKDIRLVINFNFTIKRRQFEKNDRSKHTPY